MMCCHRSASSIRRMITIYGFRHAWQQCLLHPFQLCRRGRSATCKTVTPLPAAYPIDILLREQNARSMSHISTAQLDMLKFSTLSDKCICCHIRGSTDCPLRPWHAVTADALHTPIGEKIDGQEVDMSDFEGESSAAGAASRSRGSAGVILRKKPREITAPETAI
ncbi:uncharacterized protein LOC124687930 isoform X2 [Lolium rigidum]|nr:uncharacterized protein LOC124687930 isoform X2 [Lolium rigidum]